MQFMFVSRVSQVPASRCISITHSSNGKADFASQDMQEHVNRKQPFLPTYDKASNISTSLLINALLE